MQSQLQRFLTSSVCRQIPSLAYSASTCCKNCLTDRRRAATDQWHTYTDPFFQAHTHSISSLRCCDQSGLTQWCACVFVCAGNALGGSAPPALQESVPQRDADLLHLWTVYTRAPAAGGAKARALQAFQASASCFPSCFHCQDSLLDCLDLSLLHSVHVVPVILLRKDCFFGSPCCALWPAKWLWC